MKRRTKNLVRDCSLTKPCALVTGADYNMDHRYRSGSGSPSEKHSPSEEGQKEPFGELHYEQDRPVDDPNRIADPTDPAHSLHRGLSARQVSMIAIGGAIGTGLIIGTGQALVNSGPASILISYSITGLLCYTVMCGLGEMATWLPAAGGFAPYATRFVDPALGFALGYTYWFK